MTAVASPSHACPATTHQSFKHCSFETDVVGSNYKWDNIWGTVTYPPPPVSFNWSFNHNGIAGAFSELVYENTLIAGNPVPDGDFVAFLESDVSGAIPSFSYPYTLPGTNPGSRTWRISSS